MKLDIIGELIKNIGLGIFVNSLYALSSLNFTVYNFLDIFFSLVAMISGIILERRKNEY